MHKNKCCQTCNFNVNGSIVEKEMYVLSEYLCMPTVSVHSNTI